MIPMARRFLVVTVCLAATVAFLFGLIVAGSLTPTPAQSATKPNVSALRPSKLTTSGPAAASFADIAEQLNPSVVNIDATSRAGSRPRQRAGAAAPDSPDLFGREIPKEAISEAVQLAREALLEQYGKPQADVAVAA